MGIAGRLMAENLFARIEPLFDVGSFAAANVLIAGCGSGGGSVALQLAMSGIRNFTLIDNDTLEAENVIRHVCDLRYVGWRKVDALADAILHRNPTARIRKIDADLMALPNLNEEVGAATIVVLATDNEATRYRINEECVRSQVPFVVGRVFTRGIGGEVFAYRPSEGGCLACLEQQLERTPFRDGVREIDLASEEDRGRMYGMEIPEIKDSPGLNVDISFITSFHSRYTLDGIARALESRPEFLPPIEENYLVWGNRPIHPFQKNFQVQRIILRPQSECMVCGG
jgi:molybdopterin/thiamine biosynthesis adenylyltransferase